MFELPMRKDSLTPWKPEPLSHDFNLSLNFLQSGWRSQQA